MDRHVLILASATLALGGCVGRLETRPDFARTAALNEALEGATYSLPRLDYDVTLTRYLDSCPGTASDGKPTQLSFALEAKAKASFQRGESFVVDFSKLGGIARTGNFGIEYYENGTLKSIGASGEDQTGQIIQDLTKTALSVWSATNVGAVASRSGGFLDSLFEMTHSRKPAAIGAEVEEPFATVECTEEAAVLVAAMKATKGVLDQQTKSVELLKKGIDALSSRASLKLLTRADRERLSGMFAKLDKFESDIRSTKETLAKQRKVLGWSVEVPWKTDYSLAHNAQTLVPVDDAEDLARVNGLLRARAERRFAAPATKDRVPPQCDGSGASVHACVTAMTAIDMAFATDEPLMPGCDANDTGCERFEKDQPSYKAHHYAADPGLFVRDPVIGRMLICLKRMGAICSIKNDQAGLEPQYIPQLGQLRFIPFKILPFTGRSVSIQLSKEGRLTKLNYSTSKAMLSTAAASAANVATQVEAALEKQEARRRTDEDYRRKQDIQHSQDEIDRLTRQIALKEATTKLAGDPLQETKDATQELLAEKALLEARIAKMEAEAKLERLLEPAP